MFVLESEDQRIVFDVVEARRIPFWFRPQGFAMALVWDKSASQANRAGPGLHKWNLNAFGKHRHWNMC